MNFKANNDNFDTKHDTVRVSDALFSSALKMCGAILVERGQSPALKVAKKQAIRDVANFIEMNSNGIRISSQQILKKLNNMKARVKWKMHLQRHGKKGANLNAGEQIFYELMSAEDCQKDDIKSEILLPIDMDAEDTLKFYQDAAAAQTTEQNAPSNYYTEQTGNSMTQNRLNFETNETALLSTNELQRLVLLNQLEVCKEQKQLMAEFKQVLKQVDGLVHQLNKKQQNT